MGSGDKSGCQAWQQHLYSLSHLASPLRVLNRLCRTSKELLRIASFAVWQWRQFSVIYFYFIFIVVSEQSTILFFSVFEGCSMSLDGVYLGIGSGGAFCPFCYSWMKHSVNVKHMLLGVGIEFCVLAGFIPSSSVHCWQRSADVSPHRLCIFPSSSVSFASECLLPMRYALPCHLADLSLFMLLGL